MSTRAHPSDPHRDPAVRGGRRVPRRAGLHLDDVLVGGERQPALLGRRRRRGDHRRPDRAADDALGLVPPPQLVARPLRACGAAPGALRPQGALRPPRGRDLRQHDRVPRPCPHRRRDHEPPGAPVGERAEDDQARHRALLGDRRRVRATSAATSSASSRTRASATGARRRGGRHERSTTCTRATRSPNCATT